jgi:LDH2 family malate/lactate/ureidoglycolate dehydrogenase
MRVPIDQLRAAAEEALAAAGVLPATARDLVDHMITADLWGRSTHGMSVRFPASLQRAREGAGRRAPQVVDDRETTVVFDDGDNFGTAAGVTAVDLLIERVRRFGLASVALRNTGHTGMLGYFADRGARAGVVTLAFTHCRPMVTPPGGTQALFGSNPVAFGFPAAPDPVLVDLSTAAITYGQILVHEQQGTPLPEGLAVDADGVPTTDPAAARSGAIAPWGGHRGGALSAAIQFLAGGLTGAAVYPEGGSGYGLLLLGIDRARFGTREQYDAAMTEFLAGIADSPAAPGEEVRVPGSRRYATARAAAGRVDISDDLADLLGLCS